MYFNNVIFFNLTPGFSQDVLLNFRAFPDRDKKFENWNLISLTVADFGMCIVAFPLILLAAVARGIDQGVIGIFHEGVRFS